MISRHSVQIVFFFNWIQLRPPVSPRPAAEDAKVGVKVWLKGVDEIFEIFQIEDIVE